MELTEFGFFEKSLDFRYNQYNWHVISLLQEITLGSNFEM